MVDVAAGDDVEVAVGGRSGVGVGVGVGVAVDVAVAVAVDVAVAVVVAVAVAVGVALAGCGVSVDDAVTGVVGPVVAVGVASSTGAANCEQPANTTQIARATTSADRRCMVAFVSGDTITLLVLDTDTKPLSRADDRSGRSAGGGEHVGLDLSDVSEVVERESDRLAGGEFDDGSEIDSELGLLPSFDM